jgi:hypothetical protein
VGCGLADGKVTCVAGKTQTLFEVIRWLKRSQGQHHEQRKWQS